ncbi:transposase [Bosea sp. OAE752]
MTVSPSGQRFSNTRCQPDVGGSRQSADLKSHQPIAYRLAAGIPIMRFARVLRRDIDAVNSAIELPWSNGQAEGQINRLKTLKRAMYGRAGSELLKARMLPPLHTK